MLSIAGTLAPPAWAPARSAWLSTMAARLPLSTGGAASARKPSPPRSHSVAPSESRREWELKAIVEGATAKHASAGDISQQIGDLYTS
jgi:hypothetical protein